jgi:hypothetical protein
VFVAEADYFVALHGIMQTVSVQVDLFDACGE